MGIFPPHNSQHYIYHIAFIFLLLLAGSRFSFPSTINIGYLFPACIHITKSLVWCNPCSARKSCPCLGSVIEWTADSFHRRDP